MIRVARNSWNTLVFKKVTVFFREVPGRGPEGAIERASYTLNAGVTMVEGSICGKQISVIVTWDMHH